MLVGQTVPTVSSGTSSATILSDVVSVVTVDATDVRVDLIIRELALAHTLALLNLVIDGWHDIAFDTIHLIVPLSARLSCTDASFRDEPALSAAVTFNILEPSSSPFRVEQTISHLFNDINTTSITILNLVEASLAIRAVSVMVILHVHVLNILATTSNPLVRVFIYDLID